MALAPASPSSPLGPVTGIFRSPSQQPFVAIHRPIIRPVGVLLHADGGSCPRIARIALLVPCLTMIFPPLFEKVISYPLPSASGVTPPSRSRCLQAPRTRALQRGDIRILQTPAILPDWPVRSSCSCNSCRMSSKSSFMQLPIAEHHACPTAGLPRFFFIFILVTFPVM